jgi:hypothetical protein
VRGRVEDEDPCRECDGSGKSRDEFRCTFIRPTSGKVCNAACLRDSTVDVVRELLCYEHASEPERARREAARHL